MALASHVNKLAILGHQAPAVVERPIVLTNAVFSALAQPTVHKASFALMAPADSHQVALLTPQLAPPGQPARTAAAPLTRAAVHVVPMIQRPAQPERSATRAQILAAAASAAGWDVGCVIQIARVTAACRATASSVKVVASFQELTGLHVPTVALAFRLDFLVSAETSVSDFLLRTAEPSAVQPPTKSVEWPPNEQKLA